MIPDPVYIKGCTIIHTTWWRQHTQGSLCGMREATKVESVSAKKVDYIVCLYDILIFFWFIDSEFIESPYHIYGRLPSSRETSSRGYVSSNSGAFRNSQQQMSFIGDWEWICAFTLNTNHWRFKAKDVSLHLKQMLIWKYFFKKLKPLKIYQH